MNDSTIIKDFLKTGVLPIWIVLITVLFLSCQSSSEKRAWKMTFCVDALHRLGEYPLRKKGGFCGIRWKQRKLA